MITLYGEGVYVIKGKDPVPAHEQEQKIGKEMAAAYRDKAKQGTISYGILQTHNKSKSADLLQIQFDAMASHDITYVGIIQTAKASGMHRFPLPYVLTNCHNSLCAVGGTINEDDHVFGLSAAKKIWRYFCSASYCRYSSIYEGKNGRLREDDSRVGQSYSLRCIRYFGDR